MPVFQYVARTHQGKMVTGRTEGADQSAVAKILREQSLLPTSIELTSSQPSGKKKEKSKGGSIKIEDIVVMSRQFSTMIRAGLPLMEVLNILAEQSEKRVLKTLLKEVERESTASICDILDVSPGHLRVLLFRARNKLRELLESEWGARSASDLLEPDVPYNVPAMPLTHLRRQPL